MPAHNLTIIITFQRMISLKVLHLDKLSYFQLRQNFRVLRPTFASLIPNLILQLIIAMAFACKAKAMALMSPHSLIHSLTNSFID